MPSFIRTALITALLVYIVVSPAHAASIAMVTKAAGAVFHRSVGDASYRPLKTGMALDAGARVKTGRDGWLELTLADNSRFVLANETEMELSSFSMKARKREGTFNLIQGKLRASVIKLAGKQTDIRLKSATAVAGVKGTEFLMLSRGPANVLFGTEGEVKVTGGNDRGQPLTANTMTQTTRGFMPIAPVAVEPGSPLAKARNDFLAATAAYPQSWGAMDELPDIVARWNIGYGHYLADSGRFVDALHVFQLALDLASAAGVRADALLERGAVHGRFLANSEAALAEYLLVLETYPTLPQAETALYMTGQVQNEMGRFEQARFRFSQYLERYPAGKYRGSVEAFLNRLKK